MSAESRNSLLEYFRGLPDDRLYKLKQYNDMVLLPDTDVLTNVNMSQMLEKAHELADIYFPEWTDRSKSDFGEFLVELIALFSEKDFWYINAYANEATLGTSRVYSNAYVKAASLGYNAQTCKGSSAPFKITAKERGVFFSIGELRVTVDGISFYNPTELSFDSTVMDNVTLKEGKYQQEYVTFNGYNAQLLKENVDIDSIRVIYDNIEFKRVNFFGESDKDSRHFRVLPEDGGGASVFFGNGEFGYCPTVGSTILVCYALTNGSDGNVRVTNCSCTMSEISYVEMKSDASGGCYAESLEALREKAPLFFKGKTILNKKVGKEFLDSFECIRQSDLKFEGANVSYFFLENAGYTKEQALSILRKEFEPYAMVGYSISYLADTKVKLLGTEFSYFRADVELEGSSYDTEEIARIIKGEIQLITDPVNGYATYGQSLTPSDITYRIKSRVPNVRSISYWKQKSATAQPEEDMALGSLNLSEGEIFEPLALDKITVTFV